MSTKKEIIEKLKSLKGEGVFEIKAEFEAEATRLPELSKLKDLTSEAGLPIILKIGGVEAISDMYMALDIGVSTIVAPMAETAYAVQKFIDAVKVLEKKGSAEGCEFAINVETIGCFENLDRILALPEIDKLTGVTFGRVDFAGSLGHDRSFVNSEEMFDYVVTVFTKCRAAGLKTALGGGIDSKCLDFVARLVKLGLVDKYETRKVVFSPECVDKGDSLMKSAVEFEYMWLRYKRAYHLTAADEDLKRLEMIESRLGL
jgi:4-hydroxy-2-oxoheptanedioate aldolase